MREDARTVASRLFAEPHKRPVEQAILETLVRFGTGALTFAVRARVRVIALHDGETYRHASEALVRLGIDVDAWPVPSAGLFVVEERTLYVRSRSPMTVAHEFCHALDCALGGGVYRSSVDPRIRTNFSQAPAFVTPYAATGLDEYFAESLRAFVGVNDPASPWPRATRERLRRIDPAMFAYIDDLFRTEFSLAA